MGFCHYFICGVPSNLNGRVQGTYHTYDILMYHSIVEMDDAERVSLLLSFGAVLPSSFDLHSHGNVPVKYKISDSKWSLMITR